MCQTIFYLPNKLQGNGMSLYRARERYFDFSIKLIPM